MGAPYPIRCRWTEDGAMVPAGPYWSKRADEEYVVGETYDIEVREPRSAKSHNHYFAAVTEVWRNLPEHLAERFPTSEHLRKYALIKAGYANQRTEVCASKAEAERIAAFIRPMDEYAIVQAIEATVVVWTAQSQSTRAMGKKKFQESKDAVLGILAGMIGTDPETLRQTASQAA